MKNRFEDQRVLKTFIKQLKYRRRQTEIAVSRYVEQLEEFNNDELITLILYLSSKEDWTRKWGKRFRLIFNISVVVMFAVLYSLNHGDYVNVDNMYHTSLYIFLIALVIIAFVWFQVGKGLMNIRIFKGLAIQLMEERKKKIV